MIQLDELIFEALAPRALRAAVEQAAPLLHPPVSHWRGLDARAAGTLAAVALLLAGYFLPSEVRENVPSECGERSL